MPGLSVNLYNFIYETQELDSFDNPRRMKDWERISELVPHGYGWIHVFIHMCRTFGQGRKLMCHLISSFHGMSSRKGLLPVWVKDCGASWPYGGMFVMPTSCFGNVISWSSKNASKAPFWEMRVSFLFQDSDFHHYATIPLYKFFLLHHLLEVIWGMVWISEASPVMP